MDPDSIGFMPHYTLLLDVFHTPTAAVWWSFLAIILLIFGSAIMSASEVAFFSITEAEREDLEESESSNDNKLAKLLHKPKYLLSTILVTNNLFNIGVIVISYFIITKTITFEDIQMGPIVLPSAVFDFLVNIVIVTFFLVLFGEALPKVYATHNKLSYARWITPVFSLLNSFLTPVNYLLVNSTALIEKRIKRHNAEIDIEEINRAIDITVDNKESQNDVRMLKGIVHFGNITVRQIMRPRREVMAADASWDFVTLMDFVKENNYSRLPVFEESIDNVLGVLYIKDLLEHLHQKADFGWQKLVRETLHTPENKKIDDLLREFQATRKHLAIVVDEYGGTSGIVTMEDVVEEVIGDIKDEYDESFENALRKNADGSMIVDGVMPLGELARALGYSPDYFEEAKGDAETLAGLVLERFGRIPRNGDEITYGAFVYKVLTFKNNRIEKIKLTPITDETT